MTRDDLRDMLAHPNVAAFLRVIREGESSNDERGYFMRWPGKTFNDLSHHPAIFEPTPDGRLSSAAGAYQIVKTTWDALVRLYGFTDFSRETQDLAAVALIEGRQALAPLLRGDLDTAIARCRFEWTSLPGASENHKLSMAKARACYVGYGGRYAASVQPAPMPNAQPGVRESAAFTQEVRKSAAFTQESKPMNPFLLAALPDLIRAIPALFGIFGSGSEVAQRNEKAAQVVADTAIAITGAANIQDATEKIKADDSMRDAVQTAVLAHPAIAQLLEVGGGIQKAREADIAATQSERPFYMSPAFIITCALLPLVYMVVAAVIFGIGGAWSDEMRSVVVTAIVTGLLGSISGFYLGSSFGSKTKDTTIAKMA